MSAKGQRAKDQIIDAALNIASIDGLEGLTLGVLAKKLGRSKSGLFSHFPNKESLQLNIIETAHRMFAHQVINPALNNPRGLPRLNALVDQWVKWAKRLPGGCIFVTAAIEYDDRPGPVRDLVVSGQRDWLATISRAVQQAIDEGHLTDDADPEQFAFEVQSILLGSYWNFRLLKDKKALTRARTALSRLIERDRAQQPPEVVAVPKESSRKRNASASKPRRASPPTSQSALKSAPKSASQSTPPQKR